MNKFYKKMILIGIVVFVAIVIFFTILYIATRGKVNNNSNGNRQTAKASQSSETVNKTAVIYFSVTGTTRGIATTIASAASADLLEIEPVNKYTDEDLEYNNTECRSYKEQNDNNARPEIANEMDISNYEVIYLGYPIWYGEAPKIIFTLLDKYSFDGKKVIPFCTSDETNISKSQTTLENYNKNIKWLTGKRFPKSIDQKQISTWIKSFNSNVDVDSVD